MYNPTKEWYWKINYVSTTSRTSCIWLIVPNRFQQSSCFRSGIPYGPVDRCVLSGYESSLLLFLTSIAGWPQVWKTVFWKRKKYWNINALLGIKVNKTEKNKVNKIGIAIKETRHLNICFILSSVGNLFCLFFKLWFYCFWPIMHSHMHYKGLINCKQISCILFICLATSLGTSHIWHMHSRNKNGTQRYKTY